MGHWSDSGDLGAGRVLEIQEIRETRRLQGVRRFRDYRRFRKPLYVARKQETLRGWILGKARKMETSQTANLGKIGRFGRLKTTKNRNLFDPRRKQEIRGLGRL